MQPTNHQHNCRGTANTTPARCHQDTRTPCISMDTSETPPRHHRGTTGTPYRDTIKTARHHGDTMETPRDYQNITETPPKHQRDTRETPERHQRDTRETPPRLPLRHHQGTIETETHRPARPPGTRRRPSAFRVNNPKLLIGEQ